MSMSTLRSLRLVWRGSRGWSIVSAVLMIIQGILPLFLLYATKLVVDEITVALQADDFQSVFADIAVYIAVLSGITLLSAALGVVERLVSEIQVQLVTDYLSKVIHSKSVELDLEYYENSDYYDTLHRAQQEAQFRPTRMTNSLMQILQNSVSLVALIGLLVIFHWGIALALFVSALPGMIVRFRHADKLYKWDRDNTQPARYSVYFSWLLTNEIFAKELRLFGLGNYFIERFHRIRTRLREGRIGLARQYAVIELITQFGSTAAAFGVYLFIAFRTVQGIFTLGDFVMLYQAFQRGQGYMRAVFNSLATLYEDSLFLTNLYEFFDIEPRLQRPANPEILPRPMQAGIKFENVSFRYANSEREALKDINVAINPGEVIAIVGENGSGKTTLVKLLCRLYDPISGRITFDGINYADIDPLDLRQQFSVIFQDYAHYQLSAKENIWFGNVELPPDDERIMHAAERSGASEVINKLRDGYDTKLGKWFDDGEELSVGEWQKIALARAFLRDAQVLILDEPTSSMDAKAELQVFNKFRELAQGKTTVLISHRMSTVKMADHIYVMNNGCIVEQGTHQELMALGGLYATMYGMQASNYQ
jgi:ATP-binding cassette, subfamily B, bacterial